MALRKSLEISPDEAVVRIVMERSANPNCIFLYVEGETDVGVFEKIIEQEIGSSFNERIRTESANGKQKAKKIIKKAKDENIKNVIACLDADFDRTKNPALDDSVDIFYTDQNDLECTIYYIGALKDNHLCSELFEPTALKIILQEFNHTCIFDLLVQLASEIGKFRFLDFKNSYHLSLKDLPYAKLFLEKSFEFNKEKFFDHLKTINSSKPDSPVRMEKIDNLMMMDQEFKNTESHRPIHFCNGHDICHLISLVSQRLGGRDIGSFRAVETMLRLWFLNTHYKKSSMINKLIKRIELITRISLCVFPVLLKAIP